MDGMTHAAMIGPRGAGARRPGDLDALLYPPPALPHQPGRVREYTLAAVDREIEVAQGVTFSAWTYNGTVPGPGDPRDRGRPAARPLRQRRLAPAHDPLPRHPPGEHGRRLRDRRAGRAASPTSSRRVPYGMQLYHCHSTPLKKHIHKGLYGAFIIDPPEPRPPAQELVMVMNGFDTDGDGENNFYTVNGLAFYYAKYPIRVQPLADGADLPRQPHRVRPDQLVPPARRVLPLLPDRLERPLRVHGHGHALPGPARDHRDRLRTTPAGSCSTRTSRSSPSSAGWASSTSSTDGVDRRRREPAAAGARRLWALVPIAAARRRRSRSSPRRGGSLAGPASGATPPPADEFDVRRVEFEPGEIRIRVTNPQRDDADDRARHGRRRDRPVHASTGRRRSAGCARRTIVVPYDWVEDDPYTVGVTSSTGIETTHDVAGRRRDAAAHRRAAFLGYALIGLLVGVVPVALGLLWLPSLRRADAALARRVHGADRRACSLPRRRRARRGARAAGGAAGALGGTGLVLLGRRRQLPRADVRLAALRRRGAAASGARRSRASRWRRWSRSASACTTSARASRSARRSRSASSRSARS